MSGLPKFAISLLLVLGGVAAGAESLVVSAVLAPMPADPAYAVMRKPECGKTNEVGELVVCTAGWSRYQLTRVTALDGSSLPDMTALLYTDPEIAGPRMLELQKLSEADATQYGAAYKALRSTTLFSGACFDQPLQQPVGDTVLGPTQIQEYGAAACYLMPLWWAR